MRLMSFSMTTEAVRRQEKTVTRLLGWWDLEPGTLLQPVERAQGLRKGEHVVKIGGPIRVLSTRKEDIYDVLRYDEDEMAREGFPDMTRGEFWLMFLKAQGWQRSCILAHPVNRIEFEYLPPDVAERMVAP